MEYKYGMGGYPMLKMGYGGPMKYQDGDTPQSSPNVNEILDRDPLKDLREQYPDMDDANLQYLAQYGPQNINVDTQTWMDLVGLMSGTKLAKAGFFNLAKPAAYKGANKVAEYLGLGSPKQLPPASAGQLPPASAGQLPPSNLPVAQRGLISSPSSAVGRPIGSPAASNPVSSPIAAPNPIAVPIGRQSVAPEESPYEPAPTTYPDPDGPPAPPADASAPKEKKSSGSPEFNQAFREARHRGDLEFEWNGKKYGTRRQGETGEDHRMAMDQVRIKSRAAQIRNNPTPEEMGIIEASPIEFNRPDPRASNVSIPTPQKSKGEQRRSNREAASNERKEKRQDRKEARNSRQGAKQAIKKIYSSAEANAVPGSNVKGMKNGGEMIKRADGSYSERGLWDNIRANKGSGKKPTAEMLKQEKKIKAESKKDGGLKTPTNKGLKKLPKTVRNKMGFKKTGGVKDRRVK
jgi:hypothetical protein